MSDLYKLIAADLEPLGIDVSEFVRECVEWCVNQHQGPNLPKGIAGERPLVYFPSLGNLGEGPQDYAHDADLLGASLSDALREDERWRQKGYNVKWVETHSEEVTANSKEEAVALAFKLHYGKDWKHNSMGEGWTLTASSATAEEVER